MKLHQAILNEKQGPIPYDLILGEIIRDGNVTNPYQLHVLILLTQFFKDGLKSSRDLEFVVPYSNNATTTIAVETFMKLSPEDKVNLAQYLLDCLKAGESVMHNIDMSSIEWINYVLRKQ